MKWNKTNRTFSALAIAVATYGLSSVASAQDAPKGDIDAAKSKVSMCIGCHGIPGYKASFPEVYSVPMIAGQNEKYIAAALRAYASGERTHPTMDGISKACLPRTLLTSQPITPI